MLIFLVSVSVWPRDDSAAVTTHSTQVQQNDYMGNRRSYMNRDNVPNSLEKKYTQFFNTNTCTTYTDFV